MLAEVKPTTPTPKGRVTREVEVRLAEDADGPAIGSGVSERPCTWCGGPFVLRTSGGSPQKFCSAPCRKQFHAACRVWAEAQVQMGLVPVSALRGGIEQRVRWCRGAIALGEGEG